MKRLIVAAVVIAIAGAFFFFNRSTSEPAAREWPGDLGSLDEVPGRYQRRGNNADAERLVTLAAACGITVGTERQTGRDLDPTAGEMREWIDSQLERDDDRIEPPPPGVAGEIDPRREAIAALTAFLRSRPDIRFALDLELGTRSPVPSVAGQLRLTRLLVATALLRQSSGENAAADLEAAWILQREPWERPTLISVLTAIAGTRLVNAAARKLPERPSWFGELESFDVRRAAVAALQADTWTARKAALEAVEHDDDEAGPLHRVTDVVAKPVDRAGIGNYVAVMRALTEQVAESRTCLPDPKAARRDPQDEIPWWNRSARMAVPNLEGITSRVGRLYAERELTAKIFEAKRGRAVEASSVCSDGTWVVSSNAIRFSRDAASNARPRIPLSYRW